MNTLASFAGIGLIFMIFLILVPIALLVVLQVWLCRKGKWLGLILPVLSLLMSLLLVFSIGAFTSLNTQIGGRVTLEEDGTVVESRVYEDGMVSVYDGNGNLIDQYPDPNAGDDSRDEGLTSGALGAMAGLFLVSNIPTVVFGGIWLHYKGRRDTQDDLKRMRVEDLG